MFKIYRVLSHHQIMYVLNKAKEKLNEKGINQWEEGWDIDDLRRKCKLGFFYIFYDKGNIIGCYCLEKNKDIKWIEDKEFYYLSLLYVDCLAENQKLKMIFENNGFKYIKDFKNNKYDISIFKKE